MTFVCFSMEALPVLQVFRDSSVGVRLSVDDEVLLSTILHSFVSSVIPGGCESALGFSADFTLCSASEGGYWFCVLDLALCVISCSSSFRFERPLLHWPLIYTSVPAGLLSRLISSLLRVRALHSEMKPALQPPHLSKLKSRCYCCTFLFYFLYIYIFFLLIHFRQNLHWIIIHINLIFY